MQNAGTGMLDLSTFQEWASNALAGLGGAVAAYLGLRRRYSQDTAAITQDKAQGTLIATLIAERDAAMRSAREAWDQRTADAKAIARFEALMEAGERETNRLREELFAMRLHTRKLTAIIVRLDPQAAQMLQVDSNGDGIESPGIARTT
jgi:hypothetical protein